MKTLKVTTREKTEEGYVYHAHYGFGAIPLLLRFVFDYAMYLILKPIPLEWIESLERWLLSQQSNLEAKRDEAVRKQDEK